MERTDNHVLTAEKMGIAGGGPAGRVLPAVAGACTESGPGSWRTEEDSPIDDGTSRLLSYVWGTQRRKSFNAP